VRVVLAPLLVVVLSFAACGDDDGGGGEGDGPAQVSVQDTAGVPSAFLGYGIEQGFFEERGLDVRLTPSQGGASGT
jgi:NitT/TauT family transport system substrate-binding protein